MILKRLAALLTAMALLLAGCSAAAPASDIPDPAASSEMSAASESLSAASSLPEKPKLSELLAELAAKEEPAKDWNDPTVRELYTTTPTFQKRIESLFYNAAYGVALAGNGGWGSKGDYLFYTDFFTLPNAYDKKQPIEQDFSSYVAYINFVPLSCYQAFCDSKLIEIYPSRLGTAFAIANGDMVLTYELNAQLPVADGDKKLHQAIVDTMTQLVAGELEVTGLEYIEDDTKGTA